MNAEELKAACIAAGLEWDDGAQAWIDPSRQWLWAADEPAIPAIVMARLLAQAPHPVWFGHEMDGVLCVLNEGNEGVDEDSGFGPDHATAAIRACMAAREAT